MPNTIAMLPMLDRLNWLKERNQKFVDDFTSPAMSNLRTYYESQHPTRIMAFKCMDGRIHIPAMANMPLGSIRPMRSLGGYFDLGWPYLGYLVRKWINCNLSEAKPSLVLITYHYSEGNEHRGCAGFKYNTAAATEFTQSFLKQFTTIFGKNQAIYPLIMGIETDSEAFILHNGNDKLALIDCLDWSEAKLRSALGSLFSDMHPQMLNDLLPLVMGNIQHILEIKHSHRPVVESEHLEWLVGLGRGFDWLHEPNTGLIIGPYNPDMSEPLCKAFGIIQSNLAAGKFNDDGFVMLTSGLYNDPIDSDSRNEALGSSKMMAREKALFFQDFANRVTVKHFPDLAKKMHHLSVIVDYQTRKMEEVVGTDNFRMEF